MCFRATVLFLNLLLLSFSAIYVKKGLTHKKRVIFVEHKHKPKDISLQVSEIPKNYLIYILTFYHFEGL